MPRFRSIRLRAFAAGLIASLLASSAFADRLVETQRLVASGDGVGTLPFMAGESDGRAVVAWPLGGQVQIVLWPADEFASPRIGTIDLDATLMAVGVGRSSSGEPRLLLVADEADRSIELVFDANLLELSRRERAGDGWTTVSAAVLEDRAGGFTVVRSQESKSSGSRLELASFARDDAALVSRSYFPVDDTRDVRGVAIGDDLRLTWGSGAEGGGAEVRAQWFQRGADSITAFSEPELLDQDANSPVFIRLDGLGGIHEAWSRVSGDLRYRRSAGPRQPFVTRTIPEAGRLEAFDVDHLGGSTRLLELESGAHTLTRCLPNGTRLSASSVLAGAWALDVDGYGNVRWARASDELEVGVLRRTRLTVEGELAPGAAVPLRLRAPGDAGFVYHIFASAESGSIQIGDRSLGLGVDALFLDSLDTNSSVFQGFHGMLGPDGVGTLPMVVLPPDPALSGHTLHFGFLTLGDDGVRTVSDVLDVPIR